MGAAEILDELGVGYDLGSADGGEVLYSVELRRVDNEVSASDVAALVHDSAPVSGRAARALYVSLAEIGANVPEHSGRPHGYVAVATVDDGRHIEFAVGDAGWGLTANLRALGSRSDADSLSMVFNGGVSSTGTPGRGQGIPETRRLVTACGGSVCIVSGAAARVVSPGESRALLGQLAFPGTVVQGVLERQ
jgi:hypothetical protein